jgi:polysaccharide deacetylase family protein (PEP-CTERM system associated)
LNLQIRPVNALTVDVEDWFHVCGLARQPVVPPADWRVRGNVAKLLALLAEQKVRATFFVLGSVAEQIPELVPEIAAAGHEVASHGYSHRLVTALEPAEFHAELRLTGTILERQCGQKPVGFRAPQWSLSAKTPWVYEILHEEGYRYDSSCNPLPFIGNPAGPRTPRKIDVTSGTLWEIPPMVTPTLLGNLPTGGGWGLRVFPQALIGKTIQTLNHAGMPAVIYLHPRELDPSGPRLRLAPIKNFAAYGPRTDVSQRLNSLLQCFSFGTMRDMVEQWESV